jgi:hypothetical protein
MPSQHPAGSLKTLNAAEIHRMAKSESGAVMNLFTSNRTSRGKLSILGTIWTGYCINIWIFDFALIQPETGVLKHFSKNIINNNLSITLDQGFRLDTRLQE